MNDDNDHDVIRYTDVAADYAAARKLGAEPPDIPEQYLRHGNGVPVHAPLACRPRHLVPLSLLGLLIG